MARLIRSPAKSDDGLDPSNSSGDPKTFLGYLGSKTVRIQARSRMRGEGE